jgi:hypothetical protein
MKKELYRALVVIIVLVTPSVMGNEATRTVRNGEMVPFFFAITPAGHGVVPQSENSVTETLHAMRNQIRVVAPGGMVPVSTTAGVLVGYYADGASALAYRAVALPLPEGTRPVDIDRTRVVRVGGSTLRLSPWRLPAYPEPIVTDGRDNDWSDEEPQVLFDPHSVPIRIEDATAGRLLVPEDARFWRTGGTAVNRLYGVPGTRSFHLALDTSGVILDNTGFHFHLMTDDSEVEEYAEFAVLVDGPSGPVVYRSGDRSYRWAGQYAVRSDFIEIDISYSPLQEEVRRLRLRSDDGATIFASLTTSHRVPGRAERFLLGMTPVPESLLRQ